MCPPEFALDCLNVEYMEKGVKTRAGFDSFLQATGNWNGKATRVYEYKKRGEASRLLILDDGGKIWDSLTAMTTAVLDIATMTDFSAVTIFERVFITPHDGDVGLNNEDVYIYDGSSTARVAAGVAPSGYTLAVVDSAASGDVEEGTHLFSIAYETASGHITKFGLTGAEVKQYEAPGGKKADMTAIPVGPAGTAARHVIVTKILVDYDGNPDDKQWWFLPDGKIDGNATVVLADISFFDSSLINSAERLMNQVATIPAGACITSFGSRMIVAGEAEANATARASEPGYPESISDLEGGIAVDPGDAGGAIHYMIEHRGILFFMKDHRTYASKDNGAAPNTWNVIQVDAAQGTGVHGSGGVLDEKGQTMDQFLVCTRTGLQRFTGTYGDARELSYVIEDIWQRINPLYFEKVHISVDPIKKRAYICVPLDSATEPSHILMCDFNEGLEWDKVKWAPWLFPKKGTTSWIETKYATRETQFKFGASDGGIYVRNTATLLDFGTAIESYYRSGFVTADPSGGVCHFHAIRARCVGSGNLDLTLYGEDDATTLSPVSITLAAAPGRELYRIFSFTNEKVSLKFGVNAASEWFDMSSLRIAGKLVWEEQAHS